MAYRATEFTESRKAQTRDRLLKEARKLVSQAGFRALSIAEVARRSAIATGTVYRYFPSKSETRCPLGHRAHAGRGGGGGAHN